jgi:hypothetical protein
MVPLAPANAAVNLTAAAVAAGANVSAAIEPPVAAAAADLPTSIEAGKGGAP